MSSSHNIKVLVISNSWPSKQRPWAVIFVKNICEELTKLGIDISYFVMPRRFTGFIGSVLKYFIFILKFLVFELRKKYQIVHLHHFYPLGVLLWLYKVFHRKSRTIVTCHGSDIYYKIDGFFKRWLFLHFIKNIDVVIAVSPDLAETLKNKLKRKADFVFPIGIDERQFFRQVQEEKRFDFIFVGQFIDRKGLNELLEALSLLQDNELSICFVGSGSLQEKIERECSIEFEILGNRTQNQLCTLYNQSRFLVLPSREESFGLVASEAMYCGTPAIVSNIGGLVEQVKDGFNGLIIDKVEASTISDTLTYALSMSLSNYERLSKNAEHSNREFSLQVIAARHLEIYQDIAQH